MGMAERDPEMAKAALLARRATLRADSALIGALVGKDRAEAVAQILNAPIDADQVASTEKSDETVTWWLRKIGAPGSGLHERMTFFWHSLIPTHRHSVGWHQLVATQLNMLRANALGNFRDLLQAVVIDGAMIRYLDADSSSAKRPNENLARELMELFTTGIGHYNEGDVREAALGMTGWRVDRDTYAVWFDPERAYNEPVTFLGETKKWDVASITDRLCDHPATAARVASRLWYHLTGKEIEGAAKAELGVWWQGQNLEIKPLVERILTSDEFWADHYARPRSGFEYYAAAQNILGLDPTKLWQARNLGQLLYEPPNVGGWPRGERWLNPDSMLRRSEMMFNVDFREVSGGETATIDEILDACAIYVVSDETMAALNSAPNPEKYGPEGGVQLQWRIAMSSPEFQLQ
ncbi:MAG: DUF1800 domain-containing protein [Acidimicrobiales bacterium]